MKCRLSLGLVLCFGATLGCGDDTGSDNNYTDAGSDAGNASSTSGTGTGTRTNSTASSSGTGHTTTTTGSSADDGGSGLDGGDTTGDGGAWVDGGEGDSATGFTIGSPAFDDGDALPDAYTCEGQEFGAGYSPQLDWSGVPAGTKRLALVFKDTTIEQAGGEFEFRAFHWVAWDIPTSVSGIPEQLSEGDEPDELAGGKQFRGGPPHANEFFGPCPSWVAYACPGEPRVTDEYAFVLYAFDDDTLDYPEPVDGQPYAMDLAQFFEQNAIAATVLSATSNAKPTSSPAPCPIEDTDAGADAGDGSLDDGGASDAEAALDGASDAANDGGA